MKKEEIGVTLGVSDALESLGRVLSPTVSGIIMELMSTSGLYFFAKNPKKIQKKIQRNSKEIQRKFKKKTKKIQKKFGENSKKIRRKIKKNSKKIQKKFEENYLFFFLIF